MDEKGRIEKIMEALQLNSGQFAIQIGIQNSNLSHILNNRNKPSLEVLRKILQRYPSISSDWLILGQGAMYRQEIKSQERSLFDQIDENISLSDSLIQKSEMNSYLESNSENSNLLKNEEPAIYSKKNSAIHENTPPVSEINCMTSTSFEKKVLKIILYYTDNTFQEFESK